MFERQEQWCKERAETIKEVLKKDKDAFEYHLNMHDIPLEMKNFIRKLCGKEQKDE